MRQEITVINTSSDRVERAGHVFQPKSEAKVTVTATGRSEIKACRALSIFEPGYRCEVCGFVAKNPGALSFHKKSHKKEAAG